MLWSLLRKSARHLLILGVLAAAWFAFLWFGAAPDFHAWSTPALVALHAGPPLFCWGAWMAFRNYRQRRKSEASAKKEEAAEQERQAHLEAARRQHAEELKQQRFGCDCRAMAMAQLLPIAGNEPPLPEHEAIHVSFADADSLEPAEDLLAHLRPGIEEALLAVYERCPAAAAFPIYVAPPAGMAGEDLVAFVQATRAARAAETGWILHAGIFAKETSAPVLYLPARESVADGVIALFEKNPEIPGAVVLVFDSPWWRAQQDDEAASDDATQRRERQFRVGEPAQGVFALWLTHPDLASMLSYVPRQHPLHDPMTPYWEKDRPPVASPDWLFDLSDAALDNLLACPPLARIHRTAAGTFDFATVLQSEIAQSLEALIERAQIHSAQVTLPFEPPAEASTDIPAEDASASPPPSEPSRQSPGWLVHNAGAAGEAGRRLASLGCAFFKRGLAIDPIDTATSVTLRLGDLGGARSACMLILAVAQVAAGKASAMNAEFGDDGHLAVSFAVSPEGAA